MAEGLLWSIGSKSGPSPDLFDNYKDPSALDGLVWKTWEAAALRRWPLFHPSEADPDGGYRLHPYAVEFELEEEPSSAYLLDISYLVIAPRVAHLELRVNGVAGEAFLDPMPSSSGEIRLHAGLHTSIYCEGELEVVIPGSLLHSGKNRLELVSRDGGEVRLVENPEAIKRLDRMANGCGFIYQYLGFREHREAQDSPLRNVKLRPGVVFLHKGDGELVERCALHVELARGMDGGKLELRLTGGERSEVQELQLPARSFGHLRFELEVFDGEGEVEYELSGSLGGRSLATSGSFRRRRKWKVYISPHSHTDVGYTHRQWEVAERLSRNVDVALETLARQEQTAAAGGRDEAQDAEDRRPAQERAFVYHLDASWALENWLSTRGPERREELERRIEEGTVSVASNYADLLTQYAALEDLIRNGEFSDGLMRPLGMRAQMAAFVDVASLSGSLPALLEASGVKYLLHANNQDRGPFRLNGGLHRLSPYWWEGTSGGRVLCWLAKMYCELRKVCGSPPLATAASRGLDMWLQEYEWEGYAPDAVLLYGQEADNTDLDPQPVDFVRRWNEEHAYPKLIAADIGEFFRYVEEGYGERLARVRGDGGAYWEDGVLTSLEQTIAVRRAQAMLPAAERLEALAALHVPGRQFPLEWFDAAWRELLLYVEHTWGAFLSSTEPGALLAREQWEVKAQMAQGAEQWAKRLLHGAATRHSLEWGNEGREVVVYNPHGWTVSGPARVEINRGERAFAHGEAEPLPMRVLGSQPTQVLVELWIEELPALSYRRLRLAPAEDLAVPGRERGQLGEVHAESSTGAGEPEVSAEDLPEPVPAELALESPWYRLRVNPRRGFVSSWFDKELGRELVDPEAPWGLGQLLYAVGGEGTRLMSNQSDLPEGDPRLLGDFEPLQASLRDDELGMSVTMSGRTACGEVELEWSLSRLRKTADLRVRLEKVETTRKEALYVAFPLAQPADAALLSDSQLGWVEWHREQLPGACKEWLPLQTGVLSRSEDAQVIIASPDIPLFCAGDIVRGRWPIELDLRGGRIFSYVLSNYWHTNYKASQGGTLEFRYSLCSAAELSAAECYRHGWEQRMPLYAQRMSYQDFRRPRAPYELREGGTLATLEGAQAAITTIRKARWAEGMVVRLQEIAGEAGEATLTLPGRRIVTAWEVDLLEHDLRPLAPTADGALTVPLSPWALTTVRIVVAGPD